METAGLSELKKELKELPATKLAELCLVIAKYKKDNKELLGYLLFDAHDKPAFVAKVKNEIDAHFSELKGQTNLYHAKKSLRKILRQITKYCRYLADKAQAAELHIYFCKKLKASGIPYKRSTLIVNLYEQQLKKINALISALHEDLQNDYLTELEFISS